MQQFSGLQAVWRPLRCSSKQPQQISLASFPRNHRCALFCDVIPIPAFALVRQAQNAGEMAVQVDRQRLLAIDLDRLQLDPIGLTVDPGEFGMQARL